MSKSTNDCRHEWDGDYIEFGQCETPYCEWIEEYCPKCKRYRVTCGCGYNNFISNLPMIKERRKRNIMSLNEWDLLNI
jgi:hypothetical protein